MALTQEGRREKKVAALSSVVAAIGLTSLKIVVALLTGSLGIMAEAAHSGLDLVAALLTFFAVRVADRPADAAHNYGHSKIENLSAFIEALLLLATAGWVSYEAIHRLIFSEGLVTVNIWAFVVMFISICVDFTRSRILLRVARKLGSQALEADALHFSTDIWSSSVVIFGLLIVHLADIFHLPAWLKQADAIAALGVSGIVIWVSLQLARETVDALMDKAPEALLPQLQHRLIELPNVTEVRRLRMRKAGNKSFADIIIAAPRTLTFEQIHELSDLVENEVRAEAEKVSPQEEVDVVVHVEPIASPCETLTEQIHYLAELQGVHAHDIHIREVAGKLEVDFDLEVQADMDLAHAHEVASRLEQSIMQSNKRLRRVTTHLEAPNDNIVQRSDVTEQYQDIAHDICRIANGIAGTNSAHDIHLYLPEKVPAEIKQRELKKAPNLDLVLHTTFEAHAPLSQVHIGAEKIKRALRRAYPNLNNVVIHTEPPE
jgi:cation diffusion facilitator family transporter